MKTTLLIAAATLACGSSILAQGALPDRNASLRQEIELAISRGVACLKSRQDKDTGAWSTPDEPAVTGLVLSAIMGDPGRKPADPAGDEVKRGYDFLLKNVKPDGGIYGKGRANYNTSLALLAFVLNPRPEYEQVIRNARNFVVGQQNDFDDRGKADNPFDGGVGYGTPKPNSPAHADLSNTHFAVEALYYSKKLFEDSPHPVDKEHDLNWSAAIKFIERCQNRPASNDQKWASDDPKNHGGFVYEPGSSKAGEAKLPDGRVAMRSYGSISYAGMLSFIYAGLTPDDPRVQAALKWLGENYTLDENPGMGAEGQFYYYHTMAKALSVAGLDELKTRDGKTVNWRDDLARKLLNMQAGDGSWRNEKAARWMEGDPVLVTGYTLLALEHVHRTLR
jgi:squalene-hopene/tetraprenyl-beta-curcumene cyclase